MAFTLGPDAHSAGYRLAAFDEIGSTNAEALARARAGDPGRLWVVSDRQTAGRGRRGNAWSTERGNLAASLLTITDADAPAVATLGFVAGVALDAALRRAAPEVVTAIALDGAAGVGGDRIALKWPNDVLLDGAKLAGILLEAERAPDGRMAVVVGIGVNVRHAPTDLPYPAASLAGLGAAAGAEAVFAALSESWCEAAAAWDDGRGFPAVRARWLARASGLGGAVAVRIDGAVTRGVFETIDDTGRLVVRTENGARRTITAGEVHFGAAGTART
jgi:BirA family biotin operon repressor/biotin-[acetyl-CoA-carboxylase] ligase